MNSKTKYDIKPEQVGLIIQSAGLGEVQAIEPMSDGWYNNVLCVTTGAGDYVLKIAPAPSVRVLTHEQNLLQQELRFIALLRERTNIQMPRVFASDCSKTLIPCDYFIMEKLKGTRLDKAKLTAEEKARVKAQIHEILAEFHGIAGEGFGYEQMGLAPDWYQALRGMVQALVEDCAAFGKRCRLGTTLLRYIELHQAILNDVPSVLVNFDLHKLNLFYDQGRLSVIDLERCFWGDWVGDCVSQGLNPPEAFTRQEQIRFFLLMGYLSLITYTEKYSRYRPWNRTWWADVTATCLYGSKSLHMLRRLSKAAKNDPGMQQ